MNEWKKDGPAGQMHDGGQRHDAGEEMGMFCKRYGKCDELGNILGGLDSLHRVYVVRLAWDNLFVWGTGGNVFRDARI